MIDEWINPAGPIIDEDTINAVVETLRSGGLAQGKKVAQLEMEYAEYLGGEYHCVAVNSGTSALHVGLLAAGIGPGKEVICPTFSFAATANAVAITGAKPVLCDIDPETFCIDVQHAETLVTERTVGIMPVHLYGQAADMDSISQLANRHGLMVFEDAAQAHGATWSGRPVGTFGEFGAFSFYPTKNMTACEGGMISFKSPEHTRFAQLFRNQGMLRQYENEIVGLNLRMTDIHATVGIHQLGQLTGWNVERQRRAELYRQGLEGVVCPIVRDKSTHVYHQFTVLVPEIRDEVVSLLRDEFKVRAGVYYSTPIHQLAPYKNDLELPVAEKISRECLSLPIHPKLTDDEIHRVIESVNNAIVKVRN